jgi:hypothetical protein
VARTALPGRHALMHYAIYYGRCAHLVINSVSGSSSGCSSSSSDSVSLLGASGTVGGTPGIALGASPSDSSSGRSSSLSSALAVSTIQKYIATRTFYRRDLHASSYLDHIA